MGSAARGTRFRRPSDTPQLRSSPFEADDFDKIRAEWIISLWDAQNDLLRQRDRQVEENIRMLLGQHWIVWSELRQRFIDLSEHLSNDEKRWRHMPVLNRIFLWYQLTHARMNENPPVITWQPGPDRIDAELAEVMDPVFKYVWRDAGMLEVLDRLTSWLVPSGRAHAKSRIDLSKGELIPARARRALELLGPEGNPILGANGEPVRREFDDVPLGEDGEPLASWRDEQGLAEGMDAAPHMFYEGGIEVDVLTCLEVRGEWGSHIPWHRKNWHLQKSLLTPLQAYEAFGVELEPDVRGEEAEGVGILWRMLHGTGLFGAADSRVATQHAGAEEFVTVYELWQRPGRLEGTQRTLESPGGRLTVVTGGLECIRDGVRTAPFRYTSPIRCFDFTNLPGRPQGTSPQEMLNGPVRTRNRMHAQGIAHATKSANPPRIINTAAGIEVGQIKNLPGEEIAADLSRAGTQPPVQYVQLQRMGPEVYEAADRLANEVDQLGSMAGTEGTAPTEDSSGELVKELRYNADRPLSSPMKRMVFELARMAEDWKAMLPTIWDQKKILQVAGEDGIARALTVWPELFREGTINAEPEIESMLPEGRGERQQRMFRFWQSGVWGDPLSPDAINTFLDLARFPHMGRAVRPGGVDRTMAEQNVGKLLQGVPAEEIAVFEWYDHGIHRMVLERFMKSPEYLKVPPPIQEQMALYRLVLIAAAAEAMLQEAGRELATMAPIQGAAASLSGEVEAAASKHRPMAPAEGAPKSQSPAA